MTRDNDFEQRPNVRWENDFGPDSPMWKRYLMAAACAALVLGFLAAAIFLLGDAPGAAIESADLLGTAAFVGGLALIVVIALFAERWAIRVRHFFADRFGRSGNS